MVNEPSVFQPLKIYFTCIAIIDCFQYHNTRIDIIDCFQYHNTCIAMNDHFQYFLAYLYECTGRAIALPSALALAVAAA